MSSPIIFDQYQRYRFIQETILSAYKNGKRRILEVGGFRSPLKKLLPQHDIVELDLDKQDPAIDVIGTGLQLPFSNHAFDVVVSTDVLEHMNSKERGPFIKELTRVTSDYLILGFPHADQLNHKADHLFLEFIRSYSGGDFDFLKEHMSFGLPEGDEVRKLVESLLPEVVEIKIANVHSWALLQLCNYMLLQNPELSAIHEQFTDFFNRSLEPFSHAPPNYRTFLVASRKSVSPEVSAEIEKRSVFNDPGPVQEFAAQTFAVVNTARDMLTKRNAELEAEKLSVRALTKRVEDQDDEIAEMKSRLKDQELQIQNLEAYLNLFLQHPAYKVFKFLKKPVDPV